MNKLNDKYKLHIIIPTKDCVDLLFQTIDSIVDKKLYIENAFTNYIFYIVDTGSTPDNKEQILGFEKAMPGVTFKNIHINGYHYAKVNNHVAKNMLVTDDDHEDLILFCNNDLKLLTDCITEFVEYYDKTEDVGTIGCKLLFGDKVIQHAGQWIVRRGDDFFPTHRGLRADPKLFTKVEEVIGNTAALLLIQSELFQSIGGFNEDYDFCFEDLQMNMDCILQGKANYYLGSSISYHFESMNKEQEGYDLQKRGSLSATDYQKVFKPYAHENTDMWVTKLEQLESNEVVFG
jgi:GT2 family glycosyltransferase